MAHRVCPYLGRAGDPETFYRDPHVSHRCQAVSPMEPIDLEHQERHCFGDFEACPLFIPLVAGKRAPATARVAVEPAPVAVVAGAAETAVAVEEDGSATDRLVERVRTFTFEEWLVYGGALVIVGVVAWALTLGRGGAAPRRPPERGVLNAAAELRATHTPTSLPEPTHTVGPTRNAPPPATVPPRTPPSGGLIAAISPSESGAASFNARDKVPDTGDRQLLVGNLDGIEYAGGLSFPLGRLPTTARIDFAALELMGWDDADLAEGGEWTVELLGPDAATQFPNFTYETLVEAPAAPLAVWRIPSTELSVSKANVLEFDSKSLGYLKEQIANGYLTIRLRGPNVGDPESLFAWDSGYGEGFGIRPVLRVGFVPPPVTARPKPGEQPTEGLLIPLRDATPAPSPTALPGSLPGDFNNRMLFQSDRTGRMLLYLMDVDTHELWRVTQSWPYLVAQRRESSAAGVVASTASRPCGGAPKLDAQGEPIPGKHEPVHTCAQIVLSINGGPETEITEPGWLHYDPVVSPDGQWIAYVSDVAGNDEIFKIRVDGTGNTRLTENLWEWDKHPSWSPDGSKIAFWSNRDGRAQIYVMNADGTGQTNLSNSQFSDTDPIWVK